MNRPQKPPRRPEHERFVPTERLNHHTGEIEALPRNHDPVVEYAKDLEHAYVKALDEALTGIVERLEGRVPTNTEIALHCVRLTGPDKPDVWTWKEKPILLVEWPVEEGMPAFVMTPMVKLNEQI